MGALHTQPQAAFDNKAAPAWQIGLIWIGTAFERGTQQEQSLSVQGGNESTTFRLSGTYFTNDSFQFSSFYERISGRLKLDHEARDWLQFGGNLNLTQETNEQAGNDNLFLSPFTSSALMPPINPIRNEDGQFNFDNPWNNTPNVIATAQLNDEDLGTYRIQGNTFVEAEPISGLTLRMQGGRCHPLRLLPGPNTVGRGRCPERTGRPHDAGERALQHRPHHRMVRRSGVALLQCPGRV